MIDRIKVVDIELSRTIEAIRRLDGYQMAWVIVRLFGRPIGSFKLPVTNGVCTATAIGQAILHDLKWPVLRQYLIHALERPLINPISVESLLEMRPQDQRSPELPTLTVAICTRDRTVSLDRTLQSLSELRYDRVEVLVIDNAPSDERTRLMVEARHPAVRYVRELRPGLDWARNRAVLEASGELIAFTDDDVLVDADWAGAIAELFAKHEDVMAVTGLVVPAEIETRAQHYFEIAGGFGKGYVREWHRGDVQLGDKIGFTHGGAGRFGTGANMAFRRSVFDKIGLFDPALDVGTPTQGAGDLDMFFRVLKAGYTLVYEPAAMVRHFHRREYDKLKHQLYSNGIGLFAYFDASMRAFADERREFRRFRNWWLRVGHVRRWLIARFHPTMLPRDLIGAELKGALIGAFGGRYAKSLARSEEVKREHGPQLSGKPFVRMNPQPPRVLAETFAIRTLELTQPLLDLHDVSAYARTDITVTRYGWVIGRVTINNRHAPIGVDRLREAIVDQLAMSLLVHERHVTEGDVWVDALRALKRKLLSAHDPHEWRSSHLPEHIPVSIIVSTFDRPQDLESTLSCLCKLHTRRPLEIIVVDNNPASQQTPPIVAKFPSIRLLSETRKGASYSRNTGICASRGEIIVSTDDDVDVPPDWLERLVAPFVRQDVMVVSGNILPYEQETESQILFEKYGGLGRGEKRFEVDGRWFESTHKYPPPTWTLGGTANAAYRASIFADAEIGMMNEELSTGGPAGLGEDIYLFYKVLKAGGTIVYEPSAYLWHKHRRTRAALKRQIYNYSKAHVAYHLMTVLNDGDLRGLVNVFYAYPRWLAGCVWRKLIRKSDWPAWFVWEQVRGAAAGPLGFARALAYARKLGRSAVYVPYADRRVGGATASPSPAYAGVEAVAPLAKQGSQSR